MRRHHNHGLRKLCGCPRRNWPKCPHSWHFSFKHRGVHHRFSLERHLGRHVASKTEAEGEAERLRVAICAGTFGQPAAPPAPPECPTFAVVAAEHLKRHVKAHLRERTQQAVDYTHAFLATVPVPGTDGKPVPFTEKRFDRITTDDVDRVIEAKATPTTKTFKKGETEWTKTVGGRYAANRLHAYLRGLWNWAIRKGYVDHTPFARAGQPTISTFREHARSRRLEGDEEQRLLNAARPHLRDLVVAALETGCREGELLSLQLRQARRLQNEIFLPSTKTKAGDGRHLPISKTLRKVLDRRELDPDGEELPPTAYVFGNEVGERVGSVKTAWLGTCRRAKIADLRFHDLRHEAGSRRLEEGWPLHAVSAWLGHASIETTARYLNVRRMQLHELNERPKLKLIKSQIGR